MAYKKGKHPKHIDHDQQKTPEIGSKNNSLSDVFLNELTGAFDAFDALPEFKRIERYGNQEYLEQFWVFFQENYPNLLDTIDKKSLPIYIQTLQDKGFTIGTIKKNTSKLHNEFKSEDAEHHVIQQSLGNLQKFCENNKDIPDDAFKKFADEAGFTHDTLIVSRDGKIKNIDTIYSLWKEFVKNEHITVKDASSTEIERILSPEYNPTERIMVNIALTKIRKELKGKLRVAFDEQFPLPIDIFSSCADLLNFKTEWTQFIDDHAAEIDESLAKKLDSIIVTNGDIHKELLSSGRKFDSTKGFSQREQYFRRIFNKLVTRQLFDEVKKHQDSIDHYLLAMGNAFKQFPPYVNEILNIYPFNDKQISDLDPSYHTDLHGIDDEILSLGKQYSTVNDEERKVIRKKIKELKQQREQRKRQAYILFLKTKEPALADIFNQLVASKFDFSLLPIDQQQVLVNTLVKTKLEDTIKNKVPELLAVDDQGFSQFVRDLFDLKKKDIVIETKDGPVPISFLKKEFLATANKTLPPLSDLQGEIKNLPLNFVTQLTESNAAFFEESPIFDSIYTTFKAKNGSYKINDSYKVKIKKDGKIVEGYLSAYCPLDEYNTEEYDGKQLYLYSEPVTTSSQERKLVTREGTDSGTPVVIKDAEQQACDIEIIDKKLNLNGEALGAVIFGYVLGQQGMAQTISPEQEQALADKLGKLNVYKEKEEGDDEEAKTISETSENKVEVSEKEKFMKGWKELKGYNFADEKYKDNFGFVKGSKLFMPFADSEVPPVQTGKAWMQMEIVDVDMDKGTFKVKIHGGELRLGKAEGAVKELPINISSLESIKKSFGETIYKLPDTKHVSFDAQLSMLTAGSVATDLDKYFSSLKMSGSTFEYTLGNYAKEEITHFGIYEPKAIGESLDAEDNQLILYKVKCNANGTITVSGDSTAGNYAKNFPARDMDYVSFMLFIKEKQLQPKCKKQIEQINSVAAKDDEVPAKKRGFSINNMISFFTTGANKIKDGLKKYDEERNEDLMDTLTSKGKLYSRIGKAFGFSDRIFSSFDTMGAEYYVERDNRIRKKVEKRQKFYEDFDYSSRLYPDVIEPMLQGKITITPHYKIAAILLVHLKKGKGPYAKNFPIADGMRIGKLLGKDHQQRYLDIREKKIRDLEQNAHLYPIQWADNIKDELVELEMRYIVHVMDGRQMGIQDGDKTKWHFQEKYSKKFCDELEGAYTSFYKQSTVEEGFTKAQDANFEFARVEYFRLLPDRPQQALPFLKVMAMKAINDAQWHVFEAAVLAGVLSGVFINMTYSSTQSYIQKICRTRGFVPGIFARDIKQQTKMQRILDLFSNGEFTTYTSYSPNTLSLRKHEKANKFISSYNSSDKTFLKWIQQGNTMSRLSKFLDLTGKNIDGQTLLDIHSDPKTPLSDKLLLEEYIAKTNEKNESLDPDVQKNTSSLTGSILTKSQSVVDQMIQFDAGGFKGATGDAKEDMKKFSQKMQDAVPKGKIHSQEQVEFFLGKFFNRFGEKFSGTKKTELLKRLKYCKANAGKPEIDDILYYSIVGEIVNVLASHNATPPDELSGALGAWQNFFKNNIDSILQPSTLVRCFGGPSYKDEYELAKPKFKPRDQCVNLLDRDLKQAYTIMLPPDERREFNKSYTTFKNDLDYINTTLYETADKLYKNCGITNRFKSSATLSQASVSSAQSVHSKPTGAKIKNPETLDKLRRNLEGKSFEDENSDELLYQNDVDDDYYDRAT